jgi:hypothetical protein
MKESPIIFSTPMVQAILEGRKTQTRRIFKCSWRHDIEDGKAYIEMPDGTCNELISPYGKPGDLLWVRETFCIDSRGAHGDDPGYYYKADMPTYEDGTEIWPDSWKPCIHMPKAAARLWLQITEVKVERLMDITSEDAVKEGIENIYSQGELVFKTPSDKMLYYSGRDAFLHLWNSIHSKHQTLNPWVWAITFKVISTTGKKTTEI